MATTAGEQAWHDRDRAEIMQVLHRLSRAVDRKRWADIPDLTTADAHFDYGIFKGSVADIMVWMKERHENIERSFHSVGSSLVEFSENSALCETYITSVQKIIDPTAASAPINVLAVGRYIDVFVKQDGWRLARRHFVIDNSMTLAAASGAAGAMNLGRRDDADLLWVERARLGIA